MKFASSNGNKPFPATESTLCLFIAMRANKVKWKTIKNDLYAIQSWHKDFGVDLKLKDMVVLQRVSRGIKKFLGHCPPDKRLPVTFELIERFYDLFTLSQYDHLVFLAAMATGSFGVLRCGEFAVASKTRPAPLTTLFVRNLTFMTRSGKVEYGLLRLNVSKTDPFRSGCDVLLWDSLFRASPVKLLLAMRSARLTFTRTRPNHRFLHWHPSNYLFVLSDGTPVSKNDIISILRSCTGKLDSSRYAGHSFRIGGATSLARRGAPSWLIKAMGRWNGPSYRTYLRLDKSQLRDTVVRIAAKPVSDKNIVYLFSDN